MMLAGLALVGVVVRRRGYPAMKAGSIRQALGLGEPEAIPSPEASEPDSLTPPIKKATPGKSVKKPKQAAATQAKAEAKKPLAPARNSLGPEDKEKVIEHLRLHPKNRPVKRKTLESHITSLLGGNVSLKAVQGLIAALENEKVIMFRENKIEEYKVPKRKKKK